MPQSWRCVGPVLVVAIAVSGRSQFVSGNSNNEPFKQLVGWFCMDFIYNRELLFYSSTKLLHTIAVSFRKTFKFHGQLVTYILGIYMRIITIISVTLSTSFTFMYIILYDSL